MSKPSIKPHVVLGLSEAQWAELEAIARSHNCQTVSLMLQAVANGTLVVDWAWKWNYHEPVPYHKIMAGNPGDGHTIWA